MARNLMEFWANLPDDPFDAFYMNAPIMMHSIDENGVITKVSNFWAAALGFEPEDMIGHKSTEFLTEESRERAVKVHFPAFRAEGQIRNVQFDFVRKDKSLLPVVLSASSHYDADGNFTRSLAVIFDNEDSHGIC